MSLDSDGDARADEDAMLAALVEIHRRKQLRARTRNLDATQARILAHFERRGERLRGERLITSELLDRLFDASAAVPCRRAQQELLIEGPPGGAAIGRFSVTNRSGRSAQFELVLGDPVEGNRPVKVQFEPTTDSREPGQSGLVRVVADLRGWSSGERLTVPVQCRWREGSDRIWLVICSRATPGVAP